MGPFDSDQQEMRVQSMYVPEGGVFLAKGAATANASGWEELPWCRNSTRGPVAGVESGAAGGERWGGAARASEARLWVLQMTGEAAGAGVEGDITCCKFLMGSLWLTRMILEQSRVQSA